MEELTICFTDTETTGFFHRNCHIIQIGVLKIAHPKDDPLDLRVISEFERKLDLPEGVEVSDEVAKLNGYDAAVWKVEGKPRRETMLEYIKLLSRSSFGGQNPQFDYRFIDEELYRQGLDWPKMKNYSLFSVDMLARPLQLAGLIQNVKQETISEFFDLGEQTHDALGDIRQAVRIYQKLLHLSFFGLSDSSVADAMALEPLDLTCSG